MYSLLRTAADERTAEVEANLVDILAPLVADRSPPHAVKSGHRAPYGRAVDPAAAPPPGVATAAHVVALVGVQREGALAPPPARLSDRRDGVDDAAKTVASGRWARA